MPPHYWCFCIVWAVVCVCHNVMVTLQAAKKECVCFAWQSCMLIGMRSTKTQIWG